MAKIFISYPRDFVRIELEPAPRRDTGDPDPDRSFQDAERIGVASCGATGTGSWNCAPSSIQ